MRVEEETNKLYLLVDIDDLLVKSSDKLQEILNEKTNFKTDVLRMLEQLNRNCRYYVSKVQEECTLAKKEGRKPYLSEFPNFTSYSFDNNGDIYSKPVDAAGYYLNMANILLNQFLEERDTFLEIDNMPKGEIKKFDYQKEMAANRFNSLVVVNNIDAFHRINEYCLKEVYSLIEEAKMKNVGGVLTIPKYGDLVSMDTNDIIKKTSLKSSETDQEQQNILYSKPIENIVNCISLEPRLSDIIYNSNVYYTKSQEIVDYRAIHSMDNVNWDAVSLVERLIHSGVFAGVYFSTHHNGDREEKAKKILMQQIIPEANGFIGQRFHSTEHDGVRRGRSSKIDVAAKYLGVLPKQLVLFDDSVANCRDCKEKEGTEILYKPLTDSEKINNQIQETGFNRILKLDDNSIYGIVARAYVKMDENNKTYKK